MKIVSVSVMKNESDIVEVFVRYHLQFFDAMIIVDHGSTDSSPKILERLRREGLPLILTSTNEISCEQKWFINDNARRYLSSHRADWLFPLDLDEFLVTVDKKDVRQVLSDAGKDRPLLIPWRTYVPTSSDNKAEPVVLKRITHRLKAEQAHFTKIAVPCGLYLKTGCDIRHGNHALVHPKTQRVIGGALTSDLALAHFPVRDPNQFLGKILVGWLTTLARPTYVKSESYHRKMHFDRFMEGFNLSYGNLHTYAVSYLKKRDDADGTDLVFDPVPYDDGNVVYCSKNVYEADPIRTALATAERIALELGRLRSDLSGPDFGVFLKRLKVSIKGGMRKLFRF